MGRPFATTPEQRAEIVRLALRPPREAGVNSDYWSVDTLGERFTVSGDTIRLVLRAHRETFGPILFWLKTQP